MNDKASINMRTKLTLEVDLSKLNITPEEIYLSLSPDNVSKGLEINMECKESKLIISIEGNKIESIRYAVNDILRVLKPLEELF